VLRVTLTSKGQLTAPKDVWERLGLKSVDRVVFKCNSLEELKGSLSANKEYPGTDIERRAAREHTAKETFGRS
jgi:bifunctional DNA-binding transcriptional regulator/antitoxin component of YhaV-PrlF toxin-antitoxin module